jgi:hypothetical protein
MKRIRVIAGTLFNKDGFPIPDHVQMASLRTVREYVSRQFGGVTMYFHSGSWRSPANELVTEQGVTLEVVVPDDFAVTEDDAQFAEHFASYVKRTLSQKSVLLTVETVNGQFV